ncbi:hypothetical protein BJ085DRAFT_37385 [Dimargaris cristalligena]|uniref:Uncharacterized protein n=1 Tax=Dimargaris cristalligena TaxID=215637 RepID=A0A4P9ZX06_9FUNG|nr:hypothetical protein BJ085DRAFT_37385 [Dimargaris cristalligena]|eukprot:RKP37521.1 hypothetical protein BJ085DRAFT_37385 [Dimargaris cristalligena]
MKISAVITIVAVVAAAVAAGSAAVDAQPALVEHFVQRTNRNATFTLHVYVVHRL